jgi:uncharacterized protein YbjT (DUF2867 family)
MRVLVVEPTGLMGGHIIDALRLADRAISIRGFCRYAEPDAPCLEVLPTCGAVGEQPIEVLTATAEGGRRDGPVETIPGNTGSGRRERSIRTVPGNTGSSRRDGPIETIPGNTGSGRPKRALAFTLGEPGDEPTSSIDLVHGDLENPADRARAVEGVDIVIHSAPPFHPREAAMGTGMIDAAVAAGARRFIYVSALHAQVDSVPGNAAKLEVEAHLAGSGLDWTILRPQSFMQEIDVDAVLETATLELPCPVDLRRARLDMADLAEVVAKVVTEDCHAYASYDIASEEALSTAEVAALISLASGEAVSAGELSEKDLVKALDIADPTFAYMASAVSRLHAWQARNEGRGNANTVRWLLGREPVRFEDYVRRCLTAPLSSEGGAVDYEVRSIR